MPLPDHLFSTFEFLCEEHVSSFKLYWQITAGTVTQSNVSALADAIRAHFDGPMLACLPEEAQLGHVFVRNVTGGVEAEGFSTETPSNGTVSGQSLPEHDAVVIRRRTGLAGRAKRGRIFFPYVAEGHSESNGTLTAAGVIAYMAVATLMDQNFVSAGTGVTLTPVQPVPSQNLLLPVVMTQVVHNICTRRDRQREKVRTVTTA